MLNYEKDYHWRTTRGTGDFVFSEAEKRREYAAQCARVFKSWGYSEVITPTVEYFQSLAAGLDSGLQDKLFKFFEQDGRMLALRPEMTTPIARVVATRLEDYTLPLRCYYVADVYRNERPQASHRRQFLQAGIELIGTQERLADAEVLSVVIATLKSLGFAEFHLDIGHIDFLKGLLEEAAFPVPLAGKVKRALREKNLVALCDLVSSRQNGLEAFQRLPFLIGKKEVLREAEHLVENPRSLEALEALEGIYDLLGQDGLSDHIRFDLGMVKDFDYYTGLILETYTDNLGFSLCTGGRYDNLLKKFGRDLPAVGFAVGLERLFWALEKNGIERDYPKIPDIWLFYTDDTEGRVLPLARRIRRLNANPVIMGKTGSELPSGRPPKLPRYILIIEEDSEGRTAICIEEVAGQVQTRRKLPQSPMTEDELNAFLEGSL